jgi:ribonuclease HI
VVNSDLLQRIDKLRSKIDFTVEHVTTEHRGIKKAMKLAERGAQNEGRNLKKTGHGGGT